MKTVDLKVEFLREPLALETTTPRLSWRIEDERPDAVQKAYRIAAASTLQKLSYGEFDLWDTGRVRSSNTLDVEYAGKPLSPRSAVYWKVMAWGLDGKQCGWSEPGHFEVGFFDRRSWSPAKWVGPEGDRKESGRPCPMLRKEFSLPANPVKARLYVTAMGVMELYINGKAVAPDLYAPGWTQYKTRIESVAYDVTSLLAKDANAIGAVLGDGWFAGGLTWNFSRCHGGEHIALLARLEVELENGRRVVVNTDQTWKYTEEGPIRCSEFYNGETYDARREMDGWNKPGFADGGWRPVSVAKWPKAVLCARTGTPVVRNETLAAKVRTEPEPGRFVYDLGQNMVGHELVSIRGRRGGKVTIRCAEMLNQDGTLYTANYRKAKSTDTYIFASGGVETYEPHFTNHGFRYLELSGDLAEVPKCEDVRGVVVSSDIPKTVSFECSDDLANRLASNIWWGHRGNYMEAPTDCPQRDERLGWLGDAQVFCRTAAFNADVAPFMAKWMRDVRDDQARTSDGRFTDVSPNVLGADAGGHCAWGDAGVICPWTMYQMYGDVKILADSYDSMAKWMGYWADKCNDHGVIRYKGMWHYGDWLSPDCPIDDNGFCNPSAAPTPSDLIATAYYARCAEIVADTAAVLGKRAEARKWMALRERIAAAFRSEYVTENGRIAGDTQTAYLLALGFGLVTDKKVVEGMLDRLVFLVEYAGNRLTTGFVGTPLLCPVLSAFGRDDVAYKVFHGKDYPSWNFPILQGDATTMWERWNSYTKKRGFGDVDMNSFNHYAYGAIGEWMYTVIGGIDFADPGFKKLVFKPVPGGNVKWAKMSYMTRHGLAKCEWKLVKGKIRCLVVVPPNTSAIIQLPGRKPIEVNAGLYDIR